VSTASTTLPVLVRTSHAGDVDAAVIRCPSRTLGHANATLGVAAPSPLRWRAARRQDDKSDRGTPAADHSRWAMRESRPSAPPALAFTRYQRRGGCRARSLLLGELTSPLLPNAGVIPTSAFWESARPGVFISPTPAVRSGPDAWNHAKRQVRRIGVDRLQGRQCPPRELAAASPSPTLARWAVIANARASAPAPRSCRGSVPRGRLPRGVGKSLAWRRCLFGRECGSARSARSECWWSSGPRT
jgi:hypothetical protein